MIFQGLAGGAYADYSASAAMQECVNLIPRKVDAGNEKSPLIMVGTPGLAAFATLPYHPIRGIWGGDNRTFAVAENPADTAHAALFEVFEDGHSVNRSVPGFTGSSGTGPAGGVLDDDDSPVSFASNGDQLLIVSGGKVYCDSGNGPVQQFFRLDYFDLAIDATTNTKITSALTPFDSTDAGKTFTITGGIGFTPGTYTISSVTAGVATMSAAVGTVGSTNGEGYETLEALSASSCVFLDSFFIVAGKEVTGAQPKGPKQINISESYDGTKWDSTQSAVKEGYPDNIATLLVDHEDLWIFGDNNSSEIWNNTGASPFPFQRNPGAVIHCAAIPNTPAAASIANGVAWIGGDTRGWPTAWLARGYQPERISTHPLERIWHDYPTIEDAIAFTYVIEGHSLFVVSFPSGNATWAWDATTFLWHKWAWGADLDRHRVAYHTFEWGMHLGADYATGAIYRIDHEVYEDVGEPIIFLRTMPHLSEEMQYIAHNCFRLDHECDPNVSMTLAWTSDSGRHWSSEHAPDGPRVADGEPDRVIASEWRRLGTPRDRVYRITGTGNGKRALVQVQINPKT